jgi:alcohol dehydrogenase class IV
MAITDPGVAAAGLLAPVKNSLIHAGLQVLEFQQVEPNPRDIDCLGERRLPLTPGSARSSPSAADRRSTWPSASPCSWRTAGTRGTGRISLLHAIDSLHCRLATPASAGQPQH